MQQGILDEIAQGQFQQHGLGLHPHRLIGLQQGDIVPALVRRRRVCGDQPGRQFAQRDRFGVLVGVLSLGARQVQQLVQDASGAQGFPLQLREPLDNARKLQAVIRGVDGTEVRVESAGRVKAIPFENIEKARLVPKIEWR